MQKDERLKITPQMYYYDTLTSIEWQPYTMFHNISNFKRMFAIQMNMGFDGLVISKINTLQKRSF